jgi:hypothetical protein
LAIADPRTSERYQPKWEIWMGVFLHYAVANVVNSLATFSMRTESERGQMASETIAAWDKLVGCVLILEAHMMKLWREKDSDFEKARSRFHNWIKENSEPNHIEAMVEATEFYHELLELLSRRGFVRYKPPRSFGRPHDD